MHPSLRHTYYYSQSGGASVIASNFKKRVEADGGTFEAVECLKDVIESLGDFYDQASFILTPNGYKAQKLYALKGEDLTFARNGTRYRRDEDSLELVAIDVPAIDYTDVECPYLSLQPVRTNLLLWSEVATNTAWQNINTTDQENTTTAPNGTNTADSIFETTANAAHIQYQTVTKAAQAKTYTLSRFMKSNGRDWVMLSANDGTANGVSVWFNLATGEVGQSGVTGYTLIRSRISDAGDGWYRCSITFTTLTETTLFCAFYSATGDGITTFSGDATKGFYAWGAQLEEGRYLTSYIPTTSATVSRIADYVNPLTDATSLIGQTEGTLYWEGFSFADSTSKNLLCLSDGTLDNRIQIHLTSTNVVQGVVSNGGVTQAQISSAGFNSYDPYKVAMTYQNNKVALFVNGDKIGEDLTATIPGCSRLAFDPDGSLPFYGNGRCWAVSKQALSDSDAITLTT